MTPPELERMMGEFFRCVSFEEGGKPDYQALHALLIDDGKLIKNSLESPSPEISSVGQFIAPRQKLVDSGELTSFEEVELGAITEVFGNIAHRLSTYEKRGTLKGKPFEGRGVISTQFIKTPAGWRMSSMAWDDERPGLTLPENYRRLEAIQRP
jgi:hypothetical protein